jgi:hypothetical protein
MFLNSDRPLIGLLIWLFVIGILSISLLSLLLKLRDAYAARQIIIARFSDYSYLKLIDCLGLSPY